MQIVLTVLMMLLLASFSGEPFRPTLVSVLIWLVLHSPHPEL